MQFTRWATLLLLLLFFGGFVPPAAVPECKGEAPGNIANTNCCATENNLEQELLTATNRQRIRHGLQPLIPDSALTQIARVHSDEMARQGFISHDQPSGNLEVRMHRAGYLYDVVRENVARAGTLSIAQNLLNASSPHRSNILAADVTRVGIGIVRDQSQLDRRLYITQIFAVPHEEYPWTSVQDRSVRKVNELRRQSGAPSAQPDPLFEGLALRSISSLKVPVKREELRRLLADSADELISEGRTEFSRLGVSVQLLHNPKNLVIPDQAGEPKAGKFGTAVRQVTDNQNQAAFLVLTLIGFTR